MTKQISWTGENIGRIWDYYSSKEKYRKSYFARQAGRSLLKYIDKHAGLKKKSLLDFGSGPGFLFDHLEKMNLECFYSAADYSQRSIENLRAKHGGKEYFWVATHTDELIGKSELFDVIVFSEAIEHMKKNEGDAVLFHLWKLLKPGGHIIITCPNNETLEDNMLYCPECDHEFHRWQHMRSITAQDLATQVSMAGFKIERLQEYRFKANQPVVRKIVNKIKRVKSRGKLPQLVCVGRK